MKIYINRLDCSDFILYIQLMSNKCEQVLRLWLLTSEGKYAEQSNIVSIFSVFRQTVDMDGYKY